MKQLFFTAGMPRSGSTLLQNILNQNPEIYASATSGLAATLANLRAGWDIPEHQTVPVEVMEAQRRDVFKAVLQSYWQHVDEPIVIDKSRGWLSEIEMLSEILESDVKMLVTIRDMREILASWELLNRKDPLKQKQLYANHYIEAQTIEGRLRLYTAGDAPIGLAFNRIKDAIVRGHRSKLHFVQYEMLTHHPQATMTEIYKFLGIPNFNHDFDNIPQVTTENDSVWGFKDLHTIQTKVIPAQSKWQSVLGEAGSAYKVDWSNILIAK